MSCLPDILDLVRCSALIVFKPYILEHDFAIVNQTEATKNEVAGWNGDLLVTNKVEIRLYCLVISGDRKCIGPVVFFYLFLLPRFFLRMLNFGNL